MSIFSRLQKSPEVQPEVRFDPCHGLIMIAGDAEHRVFNPRLKAMLQTYLDSSESRSDTRQWIEQRSEYSPFGFAALCEYLELDVEGLRIGLTRWMDNVDNGLLDTTRSKDGQSSNHSFKTRMPDKRIETLPPFGLVAASSRGEITVRAEQIVIQHSRPRVPNIEPTRYAAPTAGRRPVLFHPGRHQG